MKNPNILEIGTNVGISGSYILEAIKKRKKESLLQWKVYLCFQKFPKKDLKKITNEKIQALQWFVH